MESPGRGRQLENEDGAKTGQCVEIQGKEA